MQDLKNKELFEKEINVMFKNNNVACFPDFHFHDLYEIYYCIGGAKQYIIEDNIYQMNPGDLFIINNFEIHKPLKDPTGDYRRIVLTFDPDKIKEICPRHSLELLNCFVSRKNGTHNKIKLNSRQIEKFTNLTQSMHNIDNSLFGAQALFETYFIELLVQVNRWYSENYVPKRADESFGFNSNVKNIIDYVNDNFTKNITLDKLADQFHINKHYMCQLFKNTTGTTIHKYIVSRRLSRAKVLLNQGYNVTAASDMCGFQNYTNFIRTFKSQFGMSPKQFAMKNTY